MTQHLVRRHFAFIVICTALWAVCGTTTTWAAEDNFFVAPAGNDQWSGRLAEPNAAKTDGPFASVKRAQEAVRAQKQQEPARDKPIVVTLRGGT